MGLGGEFNENVDGTIGRLENQLETSLERTVDLHRSGGKVEAVLAETAVAVGAAKALEILTGESWEAQLERREQGAGEAGESGEATGSPRRGRRSGKPKAR